MLKNKNLTDNRGIFDLIERLVLTLLKVGIAVTLVCVSVGVFYLLFKGGYYNLAVLLYKLFIFDLILIGALPLIKIIRRGINKDAN